MLPVGLYVFPEYFIQLGITYTCKIYPIDDESHISLAAIVMHYFHLLLANILLNGSIYHPHFQFEGILPKGPYPPYLSMTDRALLAGYPRIVSLMFCILRSTLGVALCRKTTFHKIRNFDVIHVTHIILFIMYVSVRITASLILCTWNISHRICTRFCCGLCFHGVIIICKFL